jgi:hypothetical protein
MGRHTVSFIRVAVLTCQYVPCQKPVSNEPEEAWTKAHERDTALSNTQDNNDTPQEVPTCGCNRGVFP